MRRPRLQLGVIAALATVALQCSAVAQDGAAAVDALISRYHELGMFNGTALVAEKGRVLLDKGYGKASFELGVPNTPETRQWIGSVTKVFTATMVVKLADLGKLSLDDHVTDLLPWYRKDTGSRVTVRQLLNHTSGLPDYMHLPGVGREGFQRAVGDDPIDVKAFAQKWCSGDLLWEPGSRWGYSNSAYVLLGAIIERATGKSYEQALKAMILDPAGMKATQDLATHPRAVVDGLATGYEKRGGQLVTRRPWNLSTAYAAGAMVSTVGDLYRFDRALDGAGFLSPAARAAMFTEGLGHYGCGWEVQTLSIGPGKAARAVAGHEGFIFWSIARIYRIPEDGVFVALVNNTGDAPLQALFTGIADILYGREPALPKPSVAVALRRTLEGKGPAALAGRLEELRLREPGGWDFGEKAMNAFGYELLQEGRAADAVAVFRLNVEASPASGNAWDSLGEGLAAAGERDEAVKAYARSLELDPSNRNAVDMLSRLTAK